MDFFGERGGEVDDKMGVSVAFQWFGVVEVGKHVAVLFVEDVVEEEGAVG